MRRMFFVLAVVLLVAAKGAGQLALLGDVQRVSGVAAGPDTFYTLTARHVQQWNAETGALRETLQGPANEDWKAFALSPGTDNLALAVIDRNGTGHTQIRLLPSGRKFVVEDLIEVVTFNREGGLLACGASGRGPVWIMEVGTGRMRWKLGDENGRASSVGGLAFSPDSQRLAAVAAGGLYMWDLSTGALRHHVVGKAGKGVVFSPDGARLYATLDGLTALDAASGAPLWNLKGDGTTLALSPDGRSLAWAGSGLRLVDAASGAPGKSVSAPVFTKANAIASSVCAAFSADGRRVVTGGDGGARLWASAGRWLGGMAVWPGLEWASYAADGSYQCDTAAEAFLRFETGGRLRLMKDFPALQSPELVHKGWLP